MKFLSDFFVHSLLLWGGGSVGGETRELPPSLSYFR